MELNNQSIQKQNHSSFCFNTQSLPDKHSSNMQNDIEEAEEMLPLSFAQEYLWFLEQYEEYPVANLLIAIEIKGFLNVDSLEKSLDILIKRHECFRTIIVECSDGILQKIKPHTRLKLKIEDIDRSKLPELLREESIRRFDLSDGPLFAIRLLRPDDNYHVLIINQHRIIADDHSIDILYDELSLIYSALTSGTEPDLPPLEQRYSEFLWRQRGHNFDLEKIYWHKKLSGYSRLNLPTDFARPEAQSYESFRYRFHIGESLTISLKELATENNTKLPMVLLTATIIVLSRYSGQYDILLGTITDLRTARIYGQFANNLPLRVDFSGISDFPKLLKLVNETWLEAHEHQNMPFLYLLNSMERNLGGPPLFNVMCIFEKSRILPVLNDLVTEEIDFVHTVYPFDLIFHIKEDERKLEWVISCNADLYHEDTIARMADQLKILLTGITNHTGPLDLLPLMTEEERKLIIYEWNKTEESFPWNSTIQELFEEQAARTPENIAVIYKEEKLTYRELNEKANQITHALRENYQYSFGKDISRETLIGIYMQRTPEMLAGTLGILKAGGACVPINPRWPEDRIQFVLDDAGITIILKGLNEKEKFQISQEGEKKTIILNYDTEALKWLPSHNANHRSESGGLAYVMYTKDAIPAGVLLEHKSIINLVESLHKTGDIRVDSRVLQNADADSGLYIAEVFSALLYGGTVCIIPDEQKRDPIVTVGFLNENRITHAIFPHSQITVLPLLPVPSLSEIIVTGDPCHEETLEFWSTGRRLFSAYGMLECTIFSTMSLYNDEICPATIGNAIQNVVLYVLDSHCSPVPIGIPGELYIGGAGLARGYLNQKELFSERFVRNPLLDQNDGQDDGNYLLFRTGDLVKRLSNGNIEFIEKIIRQQNKRDKEIESEEDRFIPPGNKKEQKLSQIFEEVLKLKRISVYDDFFALGGNMYMSLQVISLARKAGIPITLKQLCANPTVAGLATVEARKPRNAAEQDLLTGDVPLTPIQHQFLEQHGQWEDTHTIALLLRLKEQISTELLKEIMDIILWQHDSLRLRFRYNDKWEQFYSDDEISTTAPLHVSDLTKIPSQEQDQVIFERWKEQQRLLDIEKGPVIWISLFDGHHDGRQRLLFVIHHLVIDIPSLGTILEDFHSIYRQLSLSRKKNVRVPIKTSSYREWGNALLNLPKNIKSQREYWQDTERGATPLLEDMTSQNKKMNISYKVVLEHDCTNMLLNHTSVAYHTQIQDLLLSSILMAFFIEKGRTDLLVYMEENGRDSGLAGLDFRRTSGWFTSIHPVHLILPGSTTVNLSNDSPENTLDQSLADIIKSVKEQLRSVPDKGIGYGALRYLHKDISEGREKVAVGFSFHGHIYGIGHPDKLFEVVDMSPEIPVLSESFPKYPLYITGMIVNDSLAMKFFSRYFDEKTIQDIGETFINCLKRLIRHCLISCPGQFTPSDFPNLSISQEELDKVSRHFKIESLHAPGPLQQTIYSCEGKNTHMIQIRMQYERTIDIDQLRNAWEEIVANHSILRTAFINSSSGNPLAVVQKNAPLIWHEENWSSKKDYDAYLDEFLQADWQRGFEMHRAPLMRIMIIERGTLGFECILTCHQILLDNRSVFIILDELKRRYKRLTSWEPSYGIIDSPLPYEQYIYWAKAQDRNMALRFWSENLDLRSAPSSIIILPQDITRTISSQKKNTYLLNRNITEKCLLFSRENRITFHALIHIAWAIIMRQYGNENSTIFGLAVSGRPKTLPESQNMTGLFTNILPVKITLRDEESILDQIITHHNTLELTDRYSYLSLNEIEEFCASFWPKPLFSTYFVYENDNLENLLRKENVIKIRKNSIFPLSIAPSLGEQLTLKAIYDGNLIDEESISQLLFLMSMVLEWMIAHPTSLPSSCPILTKEKKRL